MSGAVPPFPQYAFMAWCSVKAQRQLYLYFLPLTSFIGIPNSTRILYNTSTSLLTESYAFSKSVTDVLSHYTPTSPLKI
jgi:hypothetical protein